MGRTANACGRHPYYDFDKRRGAYRKTEGVSRAILRRFVPHRYGTNGPENVMPGGHNVFSNLGWSADACFRFSIRPILCPTATPAFWKSEDHHQCHAYMWSVDSVEKLYPAPAGPAGAGLNRQNFL